MVASISARGGAKAALAYYGHLRQDDYYTHTGEPPGRWAGRGAERLSLQGPVTRTEFEAALNGIDPKTGERLAQRGGRARSHSAGWDMTFSAPKSISVLWALSKPGERAAIEEAQRTAVLRAADYVESTAGWARRGKGETVREQAAGLLTAQFDHHTSRELDPQLHTHCFIFNLAPRKDGTWGAIVSRDLYKAQKDASAAYRRELAGELERLGYRLDLQAPGFHVAAIPPEIERAFSKRRQAIEDAVRAHGYRTAKGMKLATLRTRQAKRDASLDELFKAWRAEAKALGFELRQDRLQSTRAPTNSPNRLPPLPAATQANAWSSPRAASSPAAAATARRTVSHIGHRLGHALRALQQPSAMTGLKPRSRQRDRERERE